MGGTRFAAAAKGSSSWHALDESEVVKACRTDLDSGLSSAEAERRLREAGPGEIARSERPSWISAFAAQFKDFMVLTLIAAAAVSALIGEAADAAAILAIVTMNAILGFAQEWRAERSLEALRRLSSPMARVVRDGSVREIEAREVVPGDILSLSAGDRVAADARLAAVHGLEIDESPLTGESFPVAKRPGTIPPDAPLGERRNMVHMGTVVTRGSGKAVVVATGMDTEVGAIAEMISASRQERTPLERRMEHLGRWLVIACIGICGLVGGAGIAAGHDPRQMFLTGVSLAVAAIPEGLPAVVTISLALGVQRMLRVNAVIRKLAAIEALGCVTVICSDKTGTLTTNEMTLRWAAVGVRGPSYAFSGTGYSPAGDIFRQEDPRKPGRDLEIRGQKVADPSKEPGLAETILAGALCGNADLQKPEGGRGIRRSNRGVSEAGFRPVGDPMEAALIVGALKAGYDLGDLRRARRIREIPFEPERRMMSVAVEVPRRMRRRPWGSWETEAYAVVAAKGAVESVLAKCTSAWHGRSARPLSREDASAIEDMAQAMGNLGLRVIAVACRLFRSAGDLAAIPEEGIESELTFLGLLGLEDPLRPGARKAVADCLSAGIRIMMLTGDHKATAVKVGRELGLAHGPGDEAAVVTGPEIDGLGASQLGRKCREARVFARVSPSHKLRLVHALKAMGHVVAMTGDGVNDAPALKSADIGIAMGRKGTEVAKEASDVVLADDDFSTIVSAVSEGRAIYDNIRKFVHYLLSCNVGEILVMLASTLMGLPLPLSPIQILWVNLVTDGLPAMALGAEPADANIMKRPPRDPRESLFSGGLGWRMAFEGAAIGLATLLAFALRLGADGDLTRARTVALVVLVACQLVHAWNCRSSGGARASALRSPYLVAATSCSAAMLYAAVRVPFLREAFSTAGLGRWEWALAAASVAGFRVAAAVVPGVRRRRREKGPQEREYMVRLKG